MLNNLLRLLWFRFAPVVLLLPRLCCFPGTFLFQDFIQIAPPTPNFSFSSCPSSFAHRNSFPFVIRLSYPFFNSFLFLLSVFFFTFFFFYVYVFLVFLFFFFFILVCLLRFFGFIIRFAGLTWNAAKTFSASPARFGWYSLRCFLASSPSPSPLRFYVLITWLCICLSRPRDCSSCRARVSVGQSSRSLPHTPSSWKQADRLLDQVFFWFSCVRSLIFSTIAEGGISYENVEWF